MAADGHPESTAGQDEHPEPTGPDGRVQGVRTVLADISRDERLEATAIQTVGSKGWDGFTIIRRTG